MATNITETELRAVLRGFIKEQGIEALAKKTKKSVGYLRIISAKNSTRRISEEVAAKLGYKMHEISQRIYEQTT